MPRTSKASETNKANQTNEANGATEMTNANPTKYVTKEVWDKLQATGVIDMSEYEVRDEMEEARKRKADDLVAVAKEHQDGFLAPFDLMSAKSAMWSLFKIGLNNRENYFKARRFGESIQARLDNETGIQLPVDLRPTNMEIDNSSVDLDRISTFYRDADAALVMFNICVLGQNAIIRENRDDPYLYEQLAKAYIMKGVSEAEYIAYWDEQDSRQLQKARDNKRQASVASTIDFVSRTHL